MSRQRQPAPSGGPAQVDNRPRWSGPVSCIGCRQTEPNDYLLGINHGAGMIQHQGRCMAQYLRRNQMVYATKHDGLAQLQLAIGRAIDVRVQHVDAGYAADVEAALDRFEFLLTLEQPAEHLATKVGEQLELF